ncbi:hypothetical protein H7J86_18530 [Mycobacterium hackensackense]|uniref:hypothetical protein n=1 Tax=Mycobacterium hackensackense TaxID=228909 RepID=UPI002265B82F|nr:hypothetical protein [Mycobacterium hackensackense]MCV7254161.1 hypothetical protein [Mycobacterium hackensackense]
MDVDVWARGTALIIAGGRPRKNTWEQLITHYANTFGAHMGVEVPYVLSAMSLMSTTMGGRQLTLGEHLIHCAGIIAEDALFQALTEVDGQSIVVPNSRRRVLSPITGLCIRIDPSGLPGFHLVVDDASIPRADNVVLFRAKIEGHYYRIATADAIGQQKRVNSTLFSVPVLKRALAIPPWWDEPDTSATPDPPTEAKC